MSYITPELSGKLAISALLLNAPDRSAWDLLGELSPGREEIVKHCSNSGLECENFHEYLHGDFHKCYEYSITDEKTQDEMFMQGMANGGS